MKDRTKIQNNGILCGIVLATGLLFAVLMYSVAHIMSPAEGLDPVIGSRAWQLDIAKGMTVVGISAGIIIFSLVLYAGKKSERYLLWVALLSYITMIRTAMNTLPFMADYPLLNVLLLGKLQYLGPAHPVANGNLHRGLMCILVSWLRYETMKQFFDVRIFGRKYFVYIAAASALAILFIGNTERFLQFLLIDYIVIYSCEFRSMIRQRHTHPGYIRILLFAWMLTVSLRGFDFLCEFSILYGNYLILRNRFNGIIESFFAIAFFIIACILFSDKFREADLLNVSLESRIREQTSQKTAMVKSLLHNLKTPLFTLSGYMDILTSLAGGNAAMEKYTVKMTDNIDYVRQMLDRVFLITQLDDGNISFQAVPFDFRRIVDEVAETTRLKCGGRNLRVTMDAEKYPCVGDPIYYRQAVQNLADNALDYTAGDGTIELELKTLDGQYELYVRDDGEGISSENLTKIFNRYFSDHHGRRNSSGLGLSITRELIEHQGGSISVSSEPGRGTEFRIEIRK